MKRVNKKFVMNSIFEVWYRGQGSIIGRVACVVNIGLTGPYFLI